MAHALGESALLEGETAVAVSQFRQAVEHLKELELPFERAKSQVRAGVALIENGERDEAVAQLVSGYRTARTLGARPLAAEAARLLASQGEAVAVPPGAEAAPAAHVDGAGAARAVAHAGIGGRDEGAVLHVQDPDPVAGDLDAAMGL